MLRLIEEGVRMSKSSCPSNNNSGISPTGRYWYDPERKAAWPYDGDQEDTRPFITLVDAEHFFPVFDTLERLWKEGYETKEQDGRWWLFDKAGEGIASGNSFRGLCVNIVLAGL